MSNINLDNDLNLFKCLMLNLLGHDFAHDFKLSQSSLKRITKKEILNNLNEIVNFTVGGKKKKKNTIKKKKIKKGGNNGTKRKNTDNTPLNKPKIPKPNNTPEKSKQNNKRQSQSNFLEEKQNDENPSKRFKEGQENEIDQFEAPEEIEEEHLGLPHLDTVDVLEESIFEIIFYIFGFINIDLPTTNDILKKSIDNSITICLKEIDLDYIKILNYNESRKLEMYDELLHELNYYILIQKIFKYLQSVNSTIDSNFQLDKLANFETIKNIKLLILEDYNLIDDIKANINVTEMKKAISSIKGGGKGNITPKYNDKIDNALIFQLIEKDIIVNDIIEKKYLDIIQDLRNELIEKINNYMNIIFQDISKKQQPTESKIVNDLLLQAIKNVFIKSSDDKKEYYYYDISSLENKICKSEFIKDVLFNFFIKFLLVPGGLIEYSGPSTNPITREDLIQNLRMVLNNSQYLGISSEILLPNTVNENNLRNYLLSVHGQDPSKIDGKTNFKYRIKSYNDNVISNLLTKNCLNIIIDEEEEDNNDDSTFDIEQLKIVNNNTKLIVKNVLDALDLSDDKYLDKTHGQFLNLIPNNIDTVNFSSEFLQIQSKILYSGILGLKSLNDLKSWNSSYWRKSPITGYSDIDKILIESFQSLNKDKLFVEKFKPPLVSSFSLEEQFCSKKGYNKQSSLSKLNKLFEIKDKAYIINNASPVKELSCRLQSNTNLYNNLLCPISSIIDAATEGQQSCPLYNSSQKNVELGNMNVNFISNGLNYLFKLNLGSSKQNVEMNVNCNLGKGFVINSILQQDISKKSLISASNTFKNISETFIYILKNTNGLSGNIWEIIDSNKNFVLKTINCGTKKSLGDFIQELNAVLSRGGYESKSYIPKSSVLPMNFNTGDISRVLFSNDRPSGVRYMLMDLYLPVKNRFSNGGYLSNFEIIITNKELTGGRRKKTLKKNKKIKKKRTKKIKN